MDKKLNSAWFILLLLVIFGRLQAQLGPCSEGIEAVAKILVIPGNNNMRLAKGTEILSSTVIGDAYRVPAEERERFIRMENDTAY